MERHGNIRGRKKRGSGWNLDAFKDVFICSCVSEQARLSENDLEGCYIWSRV